ncbi:MAG: YdcF family protein, partial [Patescibacteria group bacterium]
MNKTEAIIILGGGLKEENDKWRTTNFNEGDNFGAMGDRLRVVAANYLYKNNPDIAIIASAGKGQYKNVPDAPTVSSVILNELIELGVPKEKIIKEENSGNTWQQLQETKKIIQEKNLNKIIIISNRYHLPRIKAMINKDELLNKLLDEGKIELQSAEEICLKYDEKKWNKIIDDAYNSDVMKERVSLEK